MIEFVNRIPDANKLKQLLGLSYRGPEATAQTSNTNDRYIAAYDENRLVGFGHLSMEIKVGDRTQGHAPEIFVLSEYRNRDLIPTIAKLLHARKHIHRHSSLK